MPTLSLNCVKKEVHIILVGSGNETSLSLVIHFLLWTTHSNVWCSKVLEVKDGTGDHCWQSHFVKGHLHLRGRWCSCSVALVAYEHHTCEQQLMAYAKAYVKQATPIFILKPALNAFKAAHYFSPAKCSELKPTATEIDSLQISLVWTWQQLYRWAEVRTPCVSGCSWGYVCSNTPYLLAKLILNTARILHFHFPFHRFHKVHLP